MSTCLIVCGGTGGHLAPGIAVAQALQKHGHRCPLVISQKEVDSRLVQRYPALECLRSPGVGLTNTPFGIARFGKGLLSAYFMARRLIGQQRPACVIGFGGFLSAPYALAAKNASIPVILHEANRIPGRAIRQLRKLATRIYLPEGIVLRGARAGIVRETGFPVREEIQPMRKSEARKALGLPTEGKLLLAFGGSQGASALNQWVRDAFKKLAEKGVSVLCITGMNKGSEETQQHGEASLYFRPFADDMASVLSAADLAVARAGAGSIAEFTRCRLPSILVPFPHSADGHQDANAHYHAKGGGAVVLSQERLKELLSLVFELLEDDVLMGAMRASLEVLDSEDALAEITEDILQLIQSKKPAAA